MAFSNIYSDSEFIEVLQKDVKNPDDACRRRAARTLRLMLNKGSSMSTEAQKLLESLAYDEASVVRVVAARGAAYLSNEALIALASDEDLGVRYEIAEHARQYLHIDMECYCGTPEEADTLCAELVKKLSPVAV